MEYYKVIEVLGTGTFGTAHLCEKIHNHQKVVIKRINTSLRDEALTKAKNEVAILKSLKHPNVIDYLDSFIKNGILHIVMQYASKGTLQQLIERKRPDRFSPQIVMNYFCQILMGLHHIHSKNVIHRDLKSENIFLTGLQGDVVKIGDFGISKVLTGNKNTQTIVGTCNYLAPEICDGKPYDEKSDIWALGCILYEICEMQRMFEGTIATVVLSIANGNKKKVDVDYYGTQMNAAVQLMLQVNPEDRPTTAKLMTLPDIAPSMYVLGTTCGRIDPTEKFDFSKYE